MSSGGANGTLTGGADGVLKSGTTGSLGVLLTGTGGTTVPPTQLHVSHWSTSCASSSSSLTTTSVVVVNGSVGALSAVSVSGAFVDDVFYEAGASAAYTLPITTDSNTGAFAALLTLTCGSAR